MKRARDWAKRPRRTQALMVTTGSGAIALGAAAHDARELEKDLDANQPRDRNELIPFGN